MRGARGGLEAEIAKDTNGSKATGRIGWTNRPLAACGRLLSGGTPSKASPGFWDGDIPWFSSKELKSFELTDTELHVTQAGAESGATLVPPGAVLFVVRGMSLANEFRVGLTTVRATFNQDVKALVPTSDVDSRYLARCLRWLEPLVLSSTEESSHGTKRLPAQVFENLDIPIPPLPDQRRIADILDKADAIRRKRKEAIALTEELLRSAFLDMFGDPVTNPKGWPVKPLGELLSEIQSGWSPVCLARAASEKEWGVLKLGAVTFGRYDESENKALGPDHQPVPELEVRGGDVLFARKNTYEHVAACVLVGATRGRLMIPDLVFRLVLASSSGLSSEVLWGILSHGAKRRQIQSLAGGTAGSMPNISKERLRTVLVPVPRIETQVRFGRLLARMEQQRSKHIAAAEQSEALFRALVARAFSGHLSDREDLC